jgi:hypothetical protein
MCRAVIARAEVAKYPTYFLGPIIVSGESGGTSVIDGQQRLTSLSILLIWLHHGLTLEEDRKQIADLIFTRQYGANSYNLDVPERTAAIDALYRQELFNRDGAPESVRNILDRYDDIDELMPDEIKGPARAMFADWLIEQVYLVEIKSPSDDDGYGDLPNPEKREHYLQQNMLAQTFHEKAYERNPGLRRLIEERAISFKPYADLRTIDLEERQTVVTRLAEEIWNVSRLSEKGLSTLEMDERETA